MRLAQKFRPRPTSILRRVSLSALTENLEPSIELFADVIRNPAFTADEMERQRIRWLAGIEREKNQPVSVALRTLPPLIYGAGHAYGIPFTGSGTEELDPGTGTGTIWFRFTKTGSGPIMPPLFVVGDTTMDKILPMLEENFGNWKAPRTGIPAKNIDDVALPDKPRIIIIDKPDSPQSLILAAHIAPPTGVDNNIDIQMMNDVIGGKFSARVNQNLRVDKHWSYGAFTFLRDARGQRPWMVYAPVQSDKTAESVKELRDELERFLANEPVTNEE